MKPIHEAAVIKNGNERVAYMCQAVGNSTEAEHSGVKWELVKKSAFEDLVRKGQVRNLEFQGNVIKFTPTSEELEQLKAHNVGKAELEMITNDYFSCDLQFKALHIAMAINSSLNLAIGVSNVLTMFGMHACAVYLVGSRDAMNKFCELTKANDGRYDCGNAKRVIVMVDYLKQLLNYSGNYRFLFSTSTLEASSKLSTKGVMKLFMNTSKGSVQSDVVQLCDRLTANALAGVTESQKQNFLMSAGLR